MALPGGASGFTLQGGTYDDPAFQGMAGVLTLSAPVTHVATGERIRQTYNFSIDYSGNFSIGPLPFTDDPAFTPTGFLYTITWQALSWKSTPGNLTFQVPRGSDTAGVVDFDKLAAAPGGGIATPSTVFSVNGKTGTVTLTASDVGAAPAGSAGAVASVNGKTGAVTLGASDVGADAAGAATAAQAAAIAASAGQVTDTAMAGALGASTATAIAGRVELKAAFVAPLPTAGSFTYNPDGTIATDPDGNTYTWNTDGTPATQTKGGVTRTYTWNTDGTLASVS